MSPEEFHIVGMVVVELFLDSCRSLDLLFDCFLIDYYYHLIHYDVAWL